MSSGDRPNILLIMADQLKASAVGCCGNDVVRTPHIDALCDNGVRFDKCFVQNPICVPSRSCFLTGRYVHSHKAWSNRFELPDHEINLGRVFQDAGYHTALVGSNHIFRDPRFHGFETFQYHEWPWKDLPDTHEHHKLMRHAGPSPYSAAESSSQRIGDSMVNMIENMDGRPLFSWVSFFDPHPPHTPPKPYDTMYAPGAIDLPANFDDPAEGKPPWILKNREARGVLSEAQWRKVIACYYGQIAFLDEQVGRIVDALRRTGQLDNTIIAFTSDHGDFMGEHGVLGKPECFFDCLMHVPMILSGAALGRTGVCDELVESIGLAPALCRLGGIEPPDTMQGRDIWRVAGGKEEPIDIAVCESNLTLGVGYKPSPRFGVMARGREYKLCMYANGFVELYDLVHDPGETRNVVDDPSHAAARRDMEQRLLRWYIGAYDPHAWHSIGKMGHDEFTALMNQPRAT